jgi:hypothetical protein
MATTTPNFGWSVPTSTDLVKDGATAIETLGDSIDASLMDLKGGTTGQLLAKNSGTDMDFTWTTVASGGGITLLSTTTLTGSSVTVSSISQSYKNLFIYIKDVTSPAVGAVTLRLNGITTSSYTDHRIYYAAAGVQADFTTGTSLFLNNSNSNPAASGKFAALITIPRYTDTSMMDLDIRSSGRDATAGILISYNLGRFEAAAAVSSITINHASSFSTGTMYIYGEN